MANDNNMEKKERGFAAMDPEKQREIASRGGKAAHESGNANQFDSNTGREAGRMGGKATQENRRNAAGAPGNTSRIEAASDVFDDRRNFSDMESEE